MSRWPALMQRKTACEYLDMSVAAFEKEVAAGRLPQPVTMGGKLHWHREQIDAYISALRSDNDWRSGSNLYAA
jgi:predicted DNA-binding transcriptional regulator AlpA